MRREVRVGLPGDPFHTLYRTTVPKVFTFASLKSRFLLHDYFRVQVFFFFLSG